MKQYAKLRFRFPVETVYLTSGEVKYGLPQEANEIPVPHETFAVEYKNDGVVIVDAKGVENAENLRFTIFRKNKRIAKNITVKTAFDDMNKTVGCRALIADVFAFCFYLSTFKNETGAAECDPTRPVVYRRLGDTLKYRKLSISDAIEHLGNTRDEIIRRRDHAVRGHWRTYKNGKQVWVRAHRRGDSDLGTLTSIVSVT